MKLVGNEIILGLIYMNEIKKGFILWGIFFFRERFFGLINILLVVLNGLCGSLCDYEKVKLVFFLWDWVLKIFKE